MVLQSQHFRRGALLIWLASSSVVSAASLAVDAVFNGAFMTQLLDSKTESATASTTIEIANSTNDGVAGAAAYAARAGFGNLGVFQFTNPQSPCPACTPWADMFIMARTFDEIQITGAASGVLALDFRINGQMSWSGDSDFQGPFAGNRDTFHYWIEAGNIMELDLYAEGQSGSSYLKVETLNDGSTLNFSDSLSSTGVRSFVATGVAYIPFSGGSRSIAQTMTSQAYCGGPCMASVDTLHSARVGGLRILDIDLNPIAGAIATSESGYDYTRPISDASVPEPGTFALLALPLATLLAFRQRWAASTRRN
jgi:hypothetical protein